MPEGVELLNSGTLKVDEEVEAPLNADSIRSEESNAPESTSKPPEVPL